MTTTRTATIEIPRLPDESNRAYAARIEYVTMGPQRDLRTLGQKLNKNLTTIGDWSVKYRWVDCARQYDDQIAFITIQERTAAYKAELEAHRVESMSYGKALCSVALEMLTELRSARKTMEYNPAALATIARALTTGMDLRAHSLQLAEVLPRLTDDRE